MPGRRRLHRSLPREAAPQREGNRKITATETDRERLVAELSELRKRPGNAAKPVKTAQILLTRCWVRASWKARARLIEAAEWLVRLERSVPRPDIRPEILQARASATTEAAHGEPSRHHARAGLGPDARMHSDIGRPALENQSSIRRRTKAAMQGQRKAAGDNTAIAP